MDVERLMRIGNVLASEKDRAEAIRYLAMNVCVDCLPTIVYISKLNSELKFEHFLSFGVSSESLEATRILDAALIPEFNEIISSNQILIRPLDSKFLMQFKDVDFKYRPGWRSVVVFSFLNTFLVTITFQIQIDDNETNQNYFSMLGTLLGVYLGNLDSDNAAHGSNSHRMKQDLLGKALTERQTEILELVRQGLTNVSIAAKLGYSESLIKQETIAIYQKLGIVGRREINGSLN